ncbi:lycopene cyclase domain-containing protein [Rhodothermus marinus]|uniref:Lycopene cyclase domain protein n=1 Tax=Rhodothermus marinus (strain ATCC 43812 / DSM 4252 / R-10) TaxID=518766 RepID=D0MJ36_RHOM4|nr:lycopene cyclase domain-containing protein [Rhodothermus marinus]ACY48494.1 lycopene cyclase domain protein [Rhodothermus marinus DSM 4252]
MSYLLFLTLFIVAPLLLLQLALFFRGKALQSFKNPHRALWLLAFIALVYTTPWDNYLVYRGVWSYGPDRVLFTIGFVPIEEYLFFLLQPLLIGSLFLLRMPTPSPPHPRPRWHRSHRAGVLLYGLLTLIGWLALSTPRGLYAGLILSWAGPVLMGQWAIGGSLVRAYRRPFLEALLVGSLYLWTADALAIADGIWTIHRATSSGLLLGNLPVEEALFFLLTNLMVLQGLLLLLKPENHHD